jgi:DNA-binding NarL/FixJ family response regulator
MINFLCPHCRHPIALQLVDSDPAPAPLAPDPLAGLALVPGLSTLPQRQCQVLNLLAEGCTTKQIAARLNLHPRTVGLHIQHLKERFHAENIPHLIRLVSSGQ